MKKFILFFFFVTSLSIAQTFEQVSEIIYNKCTSCHRPGESGPMSFTNYSEVVSMASMIQDVTSNNYMPPWPPDQDYSSLLDERFLTEQEKQIIADWVSNGTPQGDPAQEAEIPVFTEGSSIGIPDIIFEMEEEYLIEGDNYDDYRVFVFPTNFDEDKYIESIEFRPDNREAVHHAIMMADVSGEGLELDGADPIYGYESYGGFGISLSPSEYVLLGGYAPGMNPIVWSGNLGMKIPAGSDILCQVHYAPSPIDEFDQSSINIFLKDAEEVEREVQMKMWIEFDWVIPAGEPNYTIERCLDFNNSFFQEDCELEEDWSVLGFLPHSHLLGKSWEVFAETPEGNQIPFIRIPDWDFNWQGFYYPTHMLHVPAGSQIKGVATYDNSASNPLNPNDPPQNMNWGELTTDEMFFCPIYYLPYEEGDENIYLGASSETYMEEVLLVQNFKLYPSPASSYLDISFSVLNGGNLKLKIYDVLGKEVFDSPERLINIGSFSEQLSIEHLEPGKYLLDLEFNGEKIKKNFIKI